MEPIQSSLKRLFNNNEGLKKMYEQMYNEVLNDPDIKTFLSYHPELTDKQINTGLMKLYEYKSQSKQCEHCESLGKCKNIVKGYSPILSIKNGEIHLTYEKCYKLIDKEKTQAQEKLIDSLYMPKEILNASVESFDDVSNRTQAIRSSIKFIQDAKEELPARGIYFTGPFGVGKTYFLGAIANELKKLHYSSILIYMPEFVREMRNSIKDDSVQEKLKYFKKTDVLMIDDIGAESQSAWFRDEILGSILQYRMMEQLPVFFTSNYTTDQLQEQLSHTSKGGVEKVKAGRIIERIYQVSEVVTMVGENRRQR